MDKCKWSFITDFIFDLVKTNRGYWIATEIYVFLHGGKDYCGKHCEVKNGFRILE